MSTVGIIGGIAPESTIQYYRLMIESYRNQMQEDRYPSIVINSIDMTRMLDMIGAGQLAQVTSYLLGEIRRLERAGADVCLLASNTPHVVFDELRRDASVPLISIVEAARDEARSLGLRRLGLFGTRFTMTGRVYPEAFSSAGMMVCVPSAEEQTYIHDAYMGELVRGVFRSETRDRVMTIARAMQTREGIDGLILGGTELPLLLGDVQDATMPLLDTTKIHVAEAVKWLVR
jgi:aspartate racemase